MRTPASTVFFGLGVFIQFFNLRADAVDMVAPREASGEQSKDEERLRGGLVLDVVLDGIGEEKLELEENLGEDEREENVAVTRLSDGAEITGDGELRGIDGPDADPLRLLHAERHGKGHEAALAVTLDGLEVVHDGDTQTRDGVQHGQHLRVVSESNPRHATPLCLTLLFHAAHVRRGLRRRKKYHSHATLTGYKTTTATTE